MHVCVCVRVCGCVRFNALVGLWPFVRADCLVPSHSLFVRSFVRLCVRVCLVYVLVRLCLFVSVSLHQVVKANKCQATYMSRRSRRRHVSRQCVQTKTCPDKELSGQMNVRQLNVQTNTCQDEHAWKYNVSTRLREQTNSRPNGYMSKQARVRTNMSIHYVRTNMCPNKYVSRQTAMTNAFQDTQHVKA